MCWGGDQCEISGVGPVPYLNIFGGTSQKNHPVVTLPCLVLKACFYQNLKVKLMVHQVTPAIHCMVHQVTPAIHCMVHQLTLHQGVAWCPPGVATSSVAPASPGVLTPSPLTESGVPPCAKFPEEKKINLPQKGRNLRIFEPPEKSYINHAPCL